MCFCLSFRFTPAKEALGTTTGETGAGSHAGCRGTTGWAKLHTGSGSHNLCTILLTEKQSICQSFSRGVDSHNLWRNPGDFLWPALGITLVARQKLWQDALQIFGSMSNARLSPNLGEIGRRCTAATCDEWFLCWFWFQDRPRVCMNQSSHVK